ncbi:uncharacterized protein K452DRAFT_307642 [Aplosporella prunicola CBS 121167]|uniref:Rhodopsin domain-containing protein n=1 Tax=Aplosporella prunicola CBS 121167 TaxID=1176127 RepID=A0A6A6BEV4_9PEZI|nr:uncharacterized protein K452DRAFT_307642 [Aplosporella prunicola CBS 121167]KAF2142702.1 hypothetical protein K452DRAFT_307642 [Aplosporella prunicola CBS 121167]
MSANEPALSPPSHVTPNLDNPQDIIRGVNFVTQGLCLPAICVCVGLRMFSRWRQLGALDWDDGFCIVSWLLMMGYCVCGILLSVSLHGGGNNQWEVANFEMETFLTIGYAAMVLYNPMALFVKLALLIITTRIFAPYKKEVWGIYVVMGLLVIYYMIAWFIKIFMCTPISAYWKREWDHCMNEGNIFIADAVFSSLSDLVILFLPLPLTWSLQMPTKKKFRVMGMLGAGGLATAFSVYRLGMVIQNETNPNQTIVFMKVVLTGNAEAGIGLICACLPAISALVARHRKDTSVDGTGSSYLHSSRSRIKDIPHKESQDEVELMHNAAESGTLGSAGGEDNGITRTVDFKVVTQSSVSEDRTVHAIGAAV